MFVLLFTLIVVLILIYFLQPRQQNRLISENNFLESFISLNGLNPLTTQYSRDTIAHRYSFNMLPAYNSSYWDANAQIHDVIKPSEENTFIMFDNRKLRREIPGSNFSSDSQQSYSTQLNMNNDLIIDNTRTMLNDYEAFKPYGTYFGNISDVRNMNSLK